MPWQMPISQLARDAPRSYLARHFAWLYGLVILIVSLYPFVGWRWPATPIWDFLSYPEPYYQSKVDDIVNVLAYVPLGSSLQSLMRRQLGGLLALLAATLIGAGLSLGVESLQVFLPNRVASNLDIIHNAAGAAAGALFTWSVGTRNFVRRMGILRHHWFVGGGWADFGLALLGMWFFTQLDPSIPLFGVVARPAGLPQPFESPIADPSLFLQMLEATDAMLNLIVVALLISLVLAQRPYLWRMIGLVALCAVLIKLATAGMLLQPYAFFQWLNWRTVAGLTVGLLVLPVLMSLRVVPQALVCGLAIIISMTVDWLWPLKADSPNAALALFKWRYTQLLNFNGMSHTVADLWPWLMLVFLLGYAIVRARVARQTWF